MSIKHHIINMGEKHLVLYFTIDFEPVELWLDKKTTQLINNANPNNFIGVLLMNLFFWQQIFDFCCELLKKEKREIFAIKSHDNLGHFNSMVYEYVAKSEGFNWIYFSETKTYHFNKYYDWWKLMCKDRTIDNRQIKYSQHYDNIYNYLKRQGLMIGDAYYEPTNKMIDILTKKLK